jgi:hypothetical protein
MKTLSINNETYTLAPMTFGEGREIFRAGSDPFEANCAMVAACLNHGDGGQRSAADIKALPYPTGHALVVACLELNGLTSS